MKRLLAWLAMSVLTVAPAQAAEVKLLAANALRAPLLELIPAFEKATGHSVTLMGGGTESIARQVGDGSVVVDVVLIASTNIDRLTASGRLVPGSRTDFARTSVALAQRPGLPKPDASTADGVKQAVLAARSIAYSTGPSGFHVAELFRKWGIEAAVKDKIKQPVRAARTGDRGPVRNDDQAGPPSGGAQPA